MPFDPSTLPPFARRNYKLLIEALAGVQISAAEDASLRWLAGQELNPTVRNLAAVMARAAASVPLTARVTGAVETPPTCWNTR